MLKKKKYSLKSKFVKYKNYSRSKSWHHSGFDKSPETSLFVECIKIKNEKYRLNKEFEYNKRNRFDSKQDMVKLFFLRLIVKFIDSFSSVLRNLRNKIIVNK